ncbi:helix-turn-helix domain-containing protein [Nitratireductor kimnyeongensis]|uniref:Helix-turn-helix domain-containing protein n=1 Tax=Nitratireductor kimnyeongensis TaxID=430679 RepID=A0ABW0T8K2_9HYPH|nr:AraC family transcriptional regulator [Nitratireductor kimnyeongensis]QZZ35874.1 AraC family transcriptional regulator [Nitratireductor kimnyeongensis]
MRPFLETLPKVPGASWSMLNRRLEDGIPFEWHHHPEYELTLTLNSTGQRFVGDHVGEYDDGDLVLVGANLPHTWASRTRRNPSLPHVALVMWFRHEWAAALGEGFAELRPIGGLLSRAETGLAFSAEVSARARPLIEALFEAELAERFLALVRVLLLLAADTDAESLASTVAARDLDRADRERIDRVLLHIHTHYAERITNAELAEIAALSSSGLHRLFRRHTRTSISDYVMRLRIGEACMRLSSNDQPIGHVAAAVGYHSLANFNRQFKALRGMTPRAYRALFRG